MTVDPYQQLASSLDFDAMRAIIDEVDKASDQILQAAHQLADEFTAFRVSNVNERPTMDMLWLLLYVNPRPDGTLYLYWRRARNSYVQDGKNRVISEHLPKPRKGGYRAATLKRNAPPWAHDVVLNTEARAQALREAAASLNQTRRSLTNLIQNFGDYEEDPEHTED